MPCYALCGVGTFSLWRRRLARSAASAGFKHALARCNPEANANAIEKIIGAASRTFSVVDTFPFPGEPVRLSRPFLSSVPCHPAAACAYRMAHFNLHRARSQLGYTGTVGTTTTAGKALA